MGGLPAKTVVPLFADYAFTPDGKVWRIRSKDVLLKPAQVPPSEIPCPGSKHPDEEFFYQLYSPVSRRTYKFSRASIKKVFTATLTK